MVLRGAKAWERIREYAVRFVPAARSLRHRVANPWQGRISMRMGNLKQRVPLGLLIACALVPVPAGAQPATGGGKGVLQTQETNTAGIVGEFIECTRKDGVLSIKIRLRNTTTRDQSVQVIQGRNFDQYYVVAGSKKYLVLRDSEKVPLAAASDGFGGLKASIKPSGAWIWWAKYPAPPADVKAITYHLPLGPPFENVPISDQ
jgi:hypothetical protein